MIERYEPVVVGDPASSPSAQFVVVAQRRSVRAADQLRPFGYAREAYFWALLASIVVFCGRGGVLVP